MSDGVALWNAEQHRWLAALGHTVWVRGALPEAVAAAVPETQSRPQALAPARREFQKPAPKSVPRPLPAEIPVPAPAVAAVGPVRRPVVGLPDRLHMALIRASGINPNAPGMDQVMAQWPASAALRADPAAKRALWPQLRALRRIARG